MKKFKEGMTSIKNKPYSGRPSISAADMNPQWVDELSDADRSVTIHKVAAQLDCGDKALKKMVKDFNIGKCVQWGYLNSWHLI